MSNDMILSLSIIINGNVNEKYYDSNGVIPYYLRKISQNSFCSLTSLHVPTEEHYNVMDENNRRENINFHRSVSIRTKDCIYGYNDECWDCI